MSHKQQYLVRQGSWRLLLRGVTEILFPNICLCCSRETVEPDCQICSFCLNEKFEDANPKNAISSSGIILPEGVAVQHALWRYDKGGELQGLLHRLKYEHLVGIGYQAGKIVAKRIQSHPVLRSLIQQKNTLLVPVPLHYLRFIRRGYNQAFFIAAGLQREFSIPICDAGDVVRRKNTPSQTGFDLGERLRNVRGAFEVHRKTKFRGRVVFVVDDVITTGATTLELSKELLTAGVSRVVILTVAQA